MAALRTIGGVFILARYIFPGFHHGRKGMVAYAFFMMFFLWALTYSRNGAYDVSIYSFFLFIHFYYYKKLKKVPDTYAKWVLPVFYVLAILSGFFTYIGSPTGELIGHIFNLSAFLYSVFGMLFLVIFDKPIDKDKRNVVVDGAVPPPPTGSVPGKFSSFCQKLSCCCKSNPPPTIVTTPYVITQDPSYFSTLMLLFVQSGVGLGMAIITASMFANPEVETAVIQSLMLQFVSNLYLAAAMKVALRATDEERFAPLMLVIYLSTDLLQTLFYIGVPLFSKTFFKMVFIQEASSMVKNCGGQELAAYTVGLRSTNPYTDPATVKKLKKKGTVDSMSEIQSCISAVFLFVVEKEGRNGFGQVFDSVTFYNVTVPGNATVADSSFLTTFCLA